MSNAFICIVGMATVFIGLICIILLCKLMSLVCSLLPEKEVETAKAPVSAPVASDIVNKQEIVAAVCAAIAEENGTDVKNIRVVSFKKA